MVSMACGISVSHELCPAYLPVQDTSASQPGNLLKPYTYFALKARMLQIQPRFARRWTQQRRAKYNRQVRNRHAVGRLVSTDTALVSHCPLPTTSPASFRFAQPRAQLPHPRQRAYPGNKKKANSPVEMRHKVLQRRVIRIRQLVDLLVQTYMP
jgi:hypothetical protein